MTVFGLLLIFILLGIAAGAGIYLHSKMADIISSIVVRQLLSALLFLTIIFGLPWLGITLLFGEMLYPVSIQKINDEYRYSQQGYGFTTTSSQGYDLNLYRHHDFWFNKELGSIRLECVGDEAISVDIMAGHNNVNRIVIKANSATALDTMLSFDNHFIIKRSIINCLIF